MEDGEASDRWIYQPSEDGSARFVLGTVGLSPLVCFGVNPSTAKPGMPDRTVARVARFARDNGFDSWVMLNVYPQITTDPNDLDRACRAELVPANRSHIAAVIDERPRTLLAAWGSLISSRAYLPTLVRVIVVLTEGSGCRWVSLGEPTKHGHPRHPLYVRADAPLRAFDVDRYVREISERTYRGDRT